MNPQPPRCVVVLGLILAPGCTDEADHPDEDGSYNCAQDGRGDELVVGLEKAGTQGQLTFRLLEATPAPPTRGDNTWVLQLTSIGTDVPASGAVMTATPFMPDHQHGTPISVEIQPMPEAGTYKLSPINLWMPGLWRTTIEVQTGQATDTAAFAFCIPS